MQQSRAGRDEEHEGAEGEDDQAGGVESSGGEAGEDPEPEEDAVGISSSPGTPGEGGVRVFALLMVTDQSNVSRANPHPASSGVPAEVRKVELSQALD